MLQGAEALPRVEPVVQDDEAERVAIVAVHPAGQAVLLDAQAHAPGPRVQRVNVSRLASRFPRP